MKSVLRTFAEHGEYFSTETVGKTVNGPMVFSFHAVTEGSHSFPWSAAIDDPVAECDSPIQFEHGSAQSADAAMSEYERLVNSLKNGKVPLKVAEERNNVFGRKLVEYMRETMGLRVVSMGRRGELCMEGVCEYGENGERSIYRATMDNFGSINVSMRKKVVDFDEN